MSKDHSTPVDPSVDLAQDRTGLATYRTELALDRTTLAWIRTTLGMASFGFGMVAFFRTLEERSPGMESLRLHRGAIRMGAALSYWGSSRRCSPACPTGQRSEGSVAEKCPSWARGP